MKMTERVEDALAIRALQFVFGAELGSKRLIANSELGLLTI
jgi:hypothetical protein